MAENKTKLSDGSVDAFIDAIDHEQKREDCRTIIELMQTATGDEPKMWGSAIIGFGSRPLRNEANGRPADWFKIGFSPRKTSLTLYGIDPASRSAALAKLGKHKTGVGCLYINKLDDINIDVLADLIKQAASEW